MPNLTLVNASGCVGLVTRISVAVLTRPAPDLVANPPTVMQEAWFEQKTKYKAVVTNRLAYPPTSAESLALPDTDPRVIAHMAYRAGQTYQRPDSTAGSIGCNT